MDQACILMTQKELKIKWEGIPNMSVILIYYGGKNLN
jgi:hypothetical protein